MKTNNVWNRIERNYMLYGMICNMLTIVFLIAGMVVRSNKNSNYRKHKCEKHYNSTNNLVNTAGDSVNTFDVDFATKESFVCIVCYNSIMNDFNKAILLETPHEIVDIPSFFRIVVSSYGCFVCTTPPQNIEHMIR